MPFTKSQKSLIARLYCEEKLTLREIARRLNSHHQLVGDTLRRDGTPIRQERGTRTRFFNQSVFVQIDSPDKAYFFGFLLADGTVDEKRGRLLVEIQKRDVEILKGLKTLLQADHPLKDMGEKRNSYRLSVQSRQMVSDLAKWGCCQNKHNKVVFPEWMTQNLYPIFLRGYLDGDGSIFLKPQRSRPSPYVEVSFSGTETFLTHVQRVLGETIGVLPGGIYQVSSKGETKVLKVRKRAHVEEILNFLYEGGGPRLERKWLTAQRILATSLTNSKASP